ncbi:hypothetical protein F5Y15DRAFT_424851 [Xylariaceae sp. FL0016]|nr:hypothetical protein F5Y15DRAFT_424851 [Xylariaceae sp. FL0016]
MGFGLPSDPCPPLPLSVKNMRDEARNRRARQRDMPFVRTPSETAHSNRLGSHRVGANRQPAITAVGEQPPASTTSFVMGIDTCGFTTSSTITCSFGEQCTNIDNYRGCCTAGATDCSETIATTCIDYGEIENTAMCGPHTLCCPETQGRCCSHFYTTADSPGTTFTHVQCQETEGFGEMFPFPPELFTTIAPLETSPATNASDTSSVQPTDTAIGDADSAVPVGAIAGAVVGVLAFILLLITVGVLVLRRRRQRDTSTVAATGAMTEQRLDEDDTDDSGRPLSGARGLLRRLRPLSTIHEQTDPVTSPKRKSARKSFGPNWPLSSETALASHPIDLEKRLSMNGPRSASASAGTSPGTEQAGSNQLPPPPQLPQQQQQNCVPILQTPTPPPPPGHRLVPPSLLSPPPRSPRHAKTESGASGASASTSTSTSTSVMGAGLKSPRLSFVPVSPIDAAFGDEVDRRMSRLEVDPRRLSRISVPGVDAVGHHHHHHHGEMSPGAASSPRRISARASVAVPDGEEPVSPVSPLEDEGDNTQRLSFVSAPSNPGDGELELDELVSPVSPDSAEGRVSPLTVSSMGSKRSSLQR